MNELPKSILNYFSAFTETRFNYSRPSAYQWTLDELTLSLIPYDELATQVVEMAKNGRFSPLSVRKGQYVVRLPSENIAKAIQTAIAEATKKSLTDRVNELRVNTPLPSGPEQQVQDEHEISKMLVREACREQNLNFRESLIKSLGVAIEIEQRSLYERNQSTRVPPAHFSARAYSQRLYEELQQATAVCTSIEEAESAFASIVGKRPEDEILYDLFFNLEAYGQYSATFTTYLYFHALRDVKVGFPLFYVEVYIRSQGGTFLITFPASIVHINTAAANYFKFGTVLTLPRATTATSAPGVVRALENYLMTHFRSNQPMLFEPVFKPLSHERDENLRLEPLIGFQAIKKEDRKVLDYSEILALLDIGEESGFVDLVKGYIDGTTPNYQLDIDGEFKNQYGPGKVQRYLPQGPIPLNASQQRILLALAKPKNRVIVVDGPPGTGKSHTIAALTYWANQEKKSLLITSHKQQALDVVERLLTDKFHEIHPIAKPTIVRLGPSVNTENSFENTLQNSVINAAGERYQDFNDVSVQGDLTQSLERAESAISIRLGQADTEQTAGIIEYQDAINALRQYIAAPSLLENFPRATVAVDIAPFRALANIGHQLPSGTTLSVIGMLENALECERLLAACEKLHERQLNLDAPYFSLTRLTPDLIALIREAAVLCLPFAKIRTLSKKDLWGGIRHLFGGPKRKERIAIIAQALCHLKYKKEIEGIAATATVSPEELTISDALKVLDRVDKAREVAKEHDALVLFTDGLSDRGIETVYALLRSLKGRPIPLGARRAVDEGLTHYEPLFKALGVRIDDCATFAVLADPEPGREHPLFLFIKLHQQLTCSTSAQVLADKDLDRIFRAKAKLIQNINDERFRMLSGSLNAISQMRERYANGKRFSREQADVLLRSVSVIIADPATISRHLPMDEGYIDVLIIDEASQVSIAESLSLILRAKQVVIFGDEYQYGAVGALNVNGDYKRGYFKDIIDAYRSDYHAPQNAAEEARLLAEVGAQEDDESATVESIMRPKDFEGQIAWLKTFDIQTSTLAFAKAIASYTATLREHFRSFPEIIGYSNEFFYRPAQMELVVNRIRTKPINEVLRFLPVKTQGRAASNTNPDEIAAIIADITGLRENGFRGTIGVIASFREQTEKLKEGLNEKLNIHQLERDHKLAVWFVGDVQGEERDIVYYSFVEDQERKNADLRTIYPVIGGTADSIRSLKMQRLNVGFSRAKDTMVFVISQPVEKYSGTQLGNALKFYNDTLQRMRAKDHFIVDESVFESPKERDLYNLLLSTDFFKANQEKLKIVPQFPIGEYLRKEFAAQVPKWRIDFLLTLADGGKERTLILEYDGIEYHFDDPGVRNANSLEYTQYDIARQLELESYGYRFLRITKLTLLPERPGDTPVVVLDRLLKTSFTH